LLRTQDLHLEVIITNLWSHNMQGKEARHSLIKTTICMDLHFNTHPPLT